MSKSAYLVYADLPCTLNLIYTADSRARSYFYVHTHLNQTAQSS